MVNKKAQGTVIDLIILVLIVSIMIIFLGNQTTGMSLDAGRSRAQSAYVQRILITTLDYSPPSVNGTIAERIGMNYCDEEIDFEEELRNTIEILNKPGHYFIFSICPEGNCAEGICSEFIEESYGCCIKTERINLAFFNMSLPSDCKISYVELYLGIWPETTKVEQC